MIWWVKMNIDWGRYKTSPQGMFEISFGMDASQARVASWVGACDPLRDQVFADGPLHSPWGKDELGVIAPLISGMIAVEEKSGGIEKCLTR
jgi:hypothetical protein